MIAPPATIERVLEALGAREDFRDGILGDLAEEFELRAERESESAARRWYFREALRAAPYLLADWARGLRKPGLMQLAKVAFASFVLAETLVFFFVLSVTSVLNLIGVSPIILVATPRGLVAPAVGLSLVAIGGLMGGCIAAWLDDRAPLVSALALGGLFTCTIIAGAVVGRSNSPAWYPLAATVMVLVASTLGGILYVRSTPSAIGGS
jgi:hypothetical protein